MREGTKQAMDVLKALNGTVVAYHRTYAQITGSVSAGLVLSQICYLWFYAAKREQFYKIDTELAADLGMGFREFRTAKGKLRKLGLIEVIAKGVPRRSYYILQESALLAQISGWAKTHQLDGKGQKSSLVETSRLDGKGQNSNLVETSRLDGKGQKSSLVETSRLDGKGQKSSLAETSRLVCLKRPDQYGQNVQTNKTTKISREREETPPPPPHDFELRANKKNLESKNEDEFIKPTGGLPPGYVPSRHVIDFEFNANEKYLAAKEKIQDLPQQFFTWFENEVLARWNKYQVNPTQLRDWCNVLWAKYEHCRVDQAVQEYRQAVSAKVWNPDLSAICKIACKIERAATGKQRGQERQRQQEAEKKRLLSEPPYVTPWQLPEDQAIEAYKNGNEFVKRMFAKHRPELVEKVKQETKPLIATG